jgi:hypothetical protein
MSFREQMSAWKEKIHPFLKDKYKLRVTNTSLDIFGGDMNLGWILIISQSQLELKDFNGSIPEDTEKYLNEIIDKLSSFGFIKSTLEFLVSE